MTETTTNTRRPIREAAKHVHRSRAFVRKLVDAGKVTAFRTGGKPDKPRLAVDVLELEAVIRMETVYVPPGLSGKAPRAIARGKPIHPAALAMLSGRPKAG